MSKTIVAIYENRSAAEVAVNQLIQEGAAKADISMLLTDETQGREFIIEGHTKVAEGTGIGATAGGAIGAIAAGLTAVGTIASGGAFLAVGPIVAAFAGAGAGGLAGGILGGLIGLGIPEHEAKLSTEDVDHGSILIGVNVHDDRVTTTTDTFEQTGATRITVH